MLLWWVMHYHPRYTDVYGWWRYNMGLGHIFPEQWMRLQSRGSTALVRIRELRAALSCCRAFLNKHVVLYHFRVKITISKINARLEVFQHLRSLRVLPSSVFCLFEVRSCSIILCHQIYLADQTDLGFWFPCLSSLSAALQACYATIPGLFLTLNPSSA